MKNLNLATKILLFPFSLLYGLGSEIRNWLYDWRILKTKRFPVPIISVGNLTVGGTGKTPVVIWLAEQLQAGGITVAVISRGYGRNSRGYQLVSNGKNILLPTRQSGDEVQLIARKLPGCIVAVCEDRAVAIKRIIREFPLQVILMDDAFQRRDIFRDWDIMLWNAREKYYGNLPLPAGSLREWHHRRKRADAFFLTRSTEVEAIPSYLQIKPVYRVQETLEDLIDLRFTSAGKLRDLKGFPAAAFAGIAHPEIFETMLRQAGLDLVFFQPFNDHYSFQLQDMHRLLDRCEQSGVEYMLCTSKDLVKIADLGIKTSIAIKVLGVEQKLKISDRQKIINKLKKLVDRAG